MSLHMEIWNSGEKEKMMNECENFIFLFHDYKVFAKCV